MPSSPTKMPPIPELSIIVPVLNEEERIERFLEGLDRQEGIVFEVILSDGNSRDETLRCADRLHDRCHFDLRICTGKRGRGRQMNAGSAMARGEWLLFLHADTGFTDRHALRTGLDALREATGRNGHVLVAGHFALRFDDTSGMPRFGTCFCEGKARLNRHGCTLGDQGLMLSRDFFAKAGRYDESLPVAEDVLLAERIRECGEFILLPANILTSPRRFYSEGYRERQTLNAMIMGLLFTGHAHFLDSLPGIYRSQDSCRRLYLEPFCREIGAKIARLSLRDRLTFWYRVGSYVRANAWQLAYALDLFRNYRKGMRAGEGEMPLLAWYDRYLDRLTDNPPGRVLATCLVWIWFGLTLQWSLLRHERKGNEKRAGS